MTRLAFTVALLLFLFSSSTFTTTYADLPSDLTPIQDPYRNTLPDPESESIATSTILLPSEKPESEPATTFDLEPDTVFSELAEQESSEQQPNETESEIAESETDTVPLTVITFRPINRQFPRRPNPMLHFRRHHRCHHHRQMKPWGPAGVRRSYGDDMILTGYKGRSDLKYPIPAGWMRFDHHRDGPDGHRFPFPREGRMMRPEGRMMRPPHHEDEDEDASNEHYPHHHDEHEPHHHDEHDPHHHHDHHHDHDHDHHHDHEQGSLISKVRKFLHHF